MPGYPGQRTGYTATPRDFWYTNHNRAWLPGPNYMISTARDGSNTGQTDEIRAGTILGKITASGLWTPCRRTAVVAGGSGSGTGVGSTTIPVTDASAFIAGEVIHVVVTAGQGQAAGTVARTITSIDYTNNLIVVDTAAQYNTGAAITADSGGALAGAEIPRGILSETVRMLPPELYNSTARDTQIVVACAGFVDVRYILGDYAACRSATVNYLDKFMWSDQQQ